MVHFELEGIGLSISSDQENKVVLPFGLEVAYGKVYCARWKGHKVAIKKYLVDTDEATQSTVIQHEINAVQRLVHHHIIRLHDTTCHQGKLVLITEYVDGGSLQQAIKSQRTADWFIKMRVAHEIAQGLDYMHSIGVIHRDLRSSNVLLTSQLQVKLCNIGLATVKARSASKSTSSDKSIQYWMAPELLTDKPKYSTKSDMFALGMTMWEMAANCTVPSQERVDSHTVAIDLRSGAHEALPEETWSNYHHWVERCWEHSPDKRPQASEMVAKFYGLETTCADHAQGAVVSNSPPLIQTTKVTHGGASQFSDEVRPFWTRANAGDVEAQVVLAAKYENGIGVDQSDTEAFEWYLRAAGLGSTEAQYKTGALSRNGRGTIRNVTIAVDWLQRAADGAHAVAQNELGWMYQYGQGVEQDYSQAQEWYHRAAVIGDDSAQNNLALMYYNGLGVEQDYSQALAWFRKSADQGNAQAQNNLGLMYWMGFGVERNHVEAVPWLRKAADQAQRSAEPRQRVGVANTQFKLGMAYWYGWGVDQDYIEAVLWWVKAADQGHSRSQFNLGSACFHGRGVDQNDVEAVTWWQKAAAQGHTGAQYRLGRAYSDGSGVEQNDIEALSWWRKAADQGHQLALFNLGSAYCDGRGVDQSDAKAVSWWRKAAAQGDADAQYNLGIMYSDGKGVKPNDVKAVQWYQRAAEQGDADAQLNLGSAYSDGRGVEQSDIEAVSWWRRAEARGNADALFTLGLVFSEGRETEASLSRDQACVPLSPTNLDEFVDDCADEEIKEIEDDWEDEELKEIEDDWEDEELEEIEDDCGNGKFEDDSEGEELDFGLDSVSPAVTSMSAIMLWLSKEACDCIDRANTGDQHAQFTLGCWRIRGKEGLDVDLQDAHNWLTLAAEGPGAIVEAFRLLGMLYDQGLGVFKNPRQALAYYNDAARLGDFPAQLRLAAVYRTGNHVVAQDRYKSYYWISQAAESGNSVAEYGLGWHHELGFGTTKNLRMAVSLYRQASEKGHREANNRLGWLYQLGQGVPRDHAKAVCHYRDAAKLGHIEAHFHLYALHARDSRRCGTCNRCIRSLKRSNSAILACRIISDTIQQRAASGDSEALVQLGQMYEQGNVQSASRQAYKLYMEAADNHYAPALVALGAFHLRQQVGPNDYDQAQMFFRRAAAHVIPQAFTWLAWTILLKQAESEAVAAAMEVGVPAAVAAPATTAVEDEEDRQAIQWLERAAELSEPVALATLARLYEHGEAGLQKDGRRAWIYYFHAAEAGNPTAMIWMAKAYASQGDTKGKTYGKLWQTKAEQWFAVASQ
ncbi:hypothetical protein DFQ27_009907 [Actinomortierella ambigua]|uniref:Protein kinase domain-containing protein n=1 Tax=Actinomortierella ambigua TaxID=1343610 RepID=A0A9P6PLU5_9FUNG|nr:hypothetical protein DFQ27_009907 [Actinomortierella ambigua]